MSIAEPTAGCDRCGREVPERELKEVFRSDDGGREKSRLCPTCLDEVMNQADDVYGVPGEAKRRGVYLADESDSAPEDATGRRAN